MTTKAHLVQELPGVKDLKTLLDLFNNKAEYEKKLNALEKVRDELNKRIELVGKISEIESMYQVASTKAAEADRDLSHARQKAAETAAKARADADALLNKARQDEAEIRAAAARLDEQSRRRAADLDERERSIAPTETRLREEQEQIAARQSALNDREAQIEARKRKLEAALS